MKKNVKKVAATVMAAMTMLVGLATSSLAAGNGIIGVKEVAFRSGLFNVYTVKVGDCNEDGVINVADLVALKSVSNKGFYWGVSAWKVYDCNGDGYVNSSDVDALSNYLIGR